MKSGLFGTLFIVTPAPRMTSAKLNAFPTFDF
jgi:hypothetical protein